MSLPRRALLLRRASFLLLVTSALHTGCSDFLWWKEGEGPPALKSSSPGPDEPNVSVLSPVTLGFSKPVDPTSAATGITLWTGTRKVMLEQRFLKGGRAVVLQPEDPLDFGAFYRVELSPTLRFGGGGSLSRASDLVFSTEGLPPPSPSLDSLVLHLEALAHDSMRGRGSGTPDELRAAVYLGARFAAYGLQEPPGGAIQSFQSYSARLGRVLTSRNVLAAVEGSGTLASEWIVLGAHYDHIGFRNLETEELGPNNGADDNGSGTVLLLEMARLYRAYVDAGGMAGRDRRSVLFAAFGAEEQGLLGSCSYVFGAPAVPLVQTRAMMNFDMVGRLRGETIYISGGETSPVWFPLLNNSNQPTLNLAFSFSSCTGCTDHVCFWRAGVPFMGFSTGTHAQYHRPGDDVDLINFPGMVRVGELVLRALNRLAVMPETPPLTGTYPTGS